MMTFVSHVSLLVLMWYPSGVDLQENVFGIVTSTVVIECSLPVTEPFWQGPPAFTIYSNADASAIINPALWNKDRLSVNSNGDLVISASMANDSGEFKCGYSSQTDILFDVKIGCSLLSVPDFGTVNSTFGYPGETAYFSCNQTYTLKGEEILTCLANGSWTDIEPKCETTPEKQDDPPGDDGPDAAPIIGGVLGGILGAAAVGAAVACGVKYNRNLKKPRNLCYNTRTKTLTFDPPKKPTAKVEKYHILIRKDQLSAKEIEYFNAKNVQGSQTNKLEDKDWLYIDEVAATETTIHYEGLTQGKNHVFRGYAENKDGFSCRAESVIENEQTRPLGADEESGLKLKEHQDGKVNGDTNM